MRMHARLLFIFMLLIGCWMLAGGTPVQSGAYTIYFESDRDGDSRIYQLDGSSAVAVTDQACRHPSVTADGTMLVYTRIEQTLWGRFWNVFYILNGEEYKLSTNEVCDELEPVISRDGAMAAFTTMRAGNLEIITVPLNRNELQYQVTNTEKPDEEPALANGEDWVYWTGRTGVCSYIFRAPAHGGDPQRITTSPTGWEEHPSVSADGRYIAYAAVTPEEIPVEETEEVEGTEPAASGPVEDQASEDEQEDGESAVPERLGSGLTGHKYPWMAGGDEVPQEEESDESLFEEDEGEAGEGKDDRSEGNSDIWVLDQVTGERTRLMSDPSWDGHPCISADGLVIVFASDRDGNYEIYMINRDGTGLRRLTENDAVDDYPAIT